MTPVEAAAAALGPLAEPDVPLGPLTTYRVGGPAALLARVDDEAALATVARAVAAAPGAAVGWAPGVVGIVALTATSVAVGALLLRAGRRPGI